VEIGYSHPILAMAARGKVTQANVAKYQKRRHKRYAKPLCQMHFPVRRKFASDLL
jgi:hypothetical protein